MLGCEWFAQTGMPVVFLHGLLGDRYDWSAPISFLQKNAQIRPLVVDLPFHGQNSPHIFCQSFEDCRQLLDETFQRMLGNFPFYLIGYSLGGRLALDYALNMHNPNLLGCLLEGANIGLATESERQARWQNDCQWASRFNEEPIEAVLSDWYQQAVFAALTEAERQSLIQIRRQNKGEAIAKMLTATSLAKQTYFAPQLAEKKHNIAFIIGENDEKFRHMAESHQLSYQLVPEAGHNAHRENPPAVAKIIRHFVQDQPDLKI